MKAIVHTKYGSPDVLRLMKVRTPVPKDDEVLIRVHATTVNRTDCGFLRADPFFVRVVSGLLRPKAIILGSELAGEVEAVGGDVTSFKQGDQVFGLTGLHFGAHAEYVCLPEDAAVAAKPANMDYEEAAAVCDGAMLAIAFIRRAGLREGQRILVNGASGSIGSAAVQLATYFGAEVTAVCNTQNLELVRSLGADAVIDYTREDFTRRGQTYDAVFDTVGKSSFRQCSGLLRKGGVYLSSELGFLAQNPLLALWTPGIGGKRIKFPIPKESKKDVRFLRDLIDAGKYKAVIDRRYPLERIVEAYRYVEMGQKTGNVVITM
ncbi:MAG TPA: NAD(P)-dependent alcohol dehydrogenase [Thermoleophilia bacterium]|nr:NAD(P)-dependent alcohol dehydrogenase [Thermoleophilia bacterium]